jgi:hypothetical protein
VTPPASKPPAFDDADVERVAQLHYDNLYGPGSWAARYGQFGNRDYRKAVHIEAARAVLHGLAAAGALASSPSDADDARAYRFLRDRVIATMPDDSWDGDESEESLLASYVDHLATATHGTCGTCGRPIAAGERWEETPDGRVHSPVCVPA